MDMKLLDQVSIVTGSGQGIGKEIALEFARQGAKVVIATLVEHEGKEVEQLIKEEGHEAIFIQTDVQSESSIKHLVEQVIRQYGRVDTLVNNAGITLFKPIWEATIDDWEKVLNIDLRGVFLCSKYVSEYMMKQKSGSIINMSSNHSQTTLPHTEIYAAAKAGINGLTRSMAQSLGEFGIRVNSICPGFTDTAHYQHWLAERNDPEMVEKEIIKLHATSRICKPEDIAKLAVYLSSEDSYMMTGSQLLIDGGVSTRLYHSDTF